MEFLKTVCDEFRKAEKHVKCLADLQEMSYKAGYESGRIASKDLDLGNFNLTELFRVLNKMYTNARENHPHLDWVYFGRGFADGVQHLLAAARMVWNNMGER